MIAVPLHGGCLCSDIRYRVSDAGLTLYACHCTDCQRQSGSAFSLSLMIQKTSLTLVRGQPAEYSLTLADDRVKISQYCSHCCTRLFCPSRVPEFVIVEAGSLDDAFRLRPVAHTWTRSALPWIQIPDDALRFDQRPGPDDFLSFIHMWKERVHSQEMK
jgi:hypothetical protein